jgi:hypothetical protein
VRNCIKFDISHLEMFHWWQMCLIIVVIGIVSLLKWEIDQD